MNIDIEAVISDAVDTLLWTSHCNGTAPDNVCDHLGLGYDCDASLHSLNYDESDLTGEARAQIEADVRDFVKANTEDITALIEAGQATAGSIGYDFILTRNREGVGFWDRGYGDRGDRLTRNAHPYGEQHAYVGDDDRVHVEG